MKARINSRGKLSQVVLLAALVLLGTSAFAMSKASMELQRPATIGGTQLAAGTYSLRWDGEGDHIQLKVFRGGKAVAETSARIVTLDHPTQDGSVVVTPHSDGTRSISRINFGKKDFALEIESDGGGPSGGGSGAAR